jgi:hypothetical protein
MGSTSVHKDWTHLLPAQHVHYGPLNVSDDGCHQTFSMLDHLLDVPSCHDCIKHLPCAISFASQTPRTWIATRGCVDEVSFHALLWSETKFRQHLPFALPIHVLERRVCIQRTTGRWCRNSISNPSRTWKLTHLRIRRLSKKRGQSETDTVMKIYKDSHISNCICFGREMPNWATPIYVRQR